MDRGRWRRLARTACLAVLCVVVASACGGSAERPNDRVAVAESEFLDVELRRLDDDTSFRLRDLDGRPAVVNFFASWCVPCVTEMPAVEAVKQELGDEVAFVGVNVQDTVEDATDLVEQTGVTWIILRDPDGELVRAVGGVGMPTTLLLDADGVIVEHRTGALEADELRDLLASSLGIEAQP